MLVGGEKSIKSKILSACSESIRNSHTYILLDRDGTLVPIVDSPFESFVPESIVDLISSLAALPEVTVAIVSARGNNRLEEDFPLENVILAGNYGLEMRCFEEKTIVHSSARKAAPAISEIYSLFASQSSNLTGLMVESHVYSLCLHLQRLEPSCRSVLERVWTEVKSKFPDLRYREVHGSYEVFPDTDWTKRDALVKICEESFANLSTRSSASERLCSANDSGKFYCYFGDSSGDEPAFEYVNEHKGLSVRVGEDSNSSARNFVSTPDDVIDILEAIRELKKPAL